MPLYKIKKTVSYNGKRLYKDDEKELDEKDAEALGSRVQKIAAKYEDKSIKKEATKKPGRPPKKWKKEED